MTIRFDGDNLIVPGNIQYGNLIPGVQRSNLQQSDLLVYPVPFVDMRVHDALQTPLPGTSAADDLGLYGGTYGTDQPLVRTYDVKTVGATTLYARFQVRLPAEYVDAQTVQIRLGAGMVTTVADVSCDLDLTAHRVGKDNTLGADLVATAAINMNSLTFADRTFTVTASSLSAGDVLDCRIAVAVNDGANVTAVIAAIASCDLLCDVKG